MRNYNKLLLFVLINASFLSSFNLFGQKLQKVNAKQKIIAYDINGNVIDSLSKELSKQSNSSSHLDQIQVQLREIEMELKKAGDDSKKTTETEQRKEALLAEKLAIIQEIQSSKSALAKEYFIIIESFKGKKNAKNALISWHNKGYNVFLFQNKVRKWYYICASVQRSYNNAIKKQYELQKDGIESWIYYWSE